jgi:hypothetical protein
MNKPQTIPDGVSAIPAITPEEIERLRNLAVIKNTLCKWSIDTGLRAPGRCRCHLVECDHPESPIWRGLSPDKPFRWKSTLCHPKKCRFFEAAR